MSTRSIGLVKRDMVVIMSMLLSLSAQKKMPLSQHHLMVKLLLEKSVVHLSPESLTIEPTELESKTRATWLTSLLPSKVLKFS